MSEAVVAMDAHGRHEFSEVDSSELRQHRIADVISRFIRPVQHWARRTALDKVGGYIVKNDVLPAFPNGTMKEGLEVRVDSRSVWVRTRLPEDELSVALSYVAPGFEQPQHRLALSLYQGDETPLRVTSADVAGMNTHQILTGLVAVRDQITSAAQPAAHV